MILPLLLIALQTTPVAPIKKGTGLPPPVQEEVAVLAPVTALLAAVNARNGAAMAQQLHGPGLVTVTIERADGSASLRQMNFADWTRGMTAGAERYDERMPSPAIEVDGDMAMVWGDYSFRVDGKLAHCGVNHLALVRTDGQWKIASIAWSQRTTGCGAE